MAVGNRARIGAFLSRPTADRPPVAAAAMVCSLALLGFQDSLVKLVSGETSLWQFFMLRALFNLILLVVLARFVWGQARPRPQRPAIVALRTGLHLCAMVLYFGGIPFLSLAEMAAGLYVFPLFVAVLSIFVLGEKVGRRRVIAILAGFTGTLLILKPGTDAFSPAGLMPVGAAFCYACAILTTRRMCREESPVTLAFGLAIGFFTLGSAGLVGFTAVPLDEFAAKWPYFFTGWHDAGLGIIAVFALCSCLNVAAMIGLGKAYQSAESSWLAPFDYSYLIFATFWGFVFWRHLPDAATFVGMALIAGAGMFVAWRERQERLRRAAGAAAGGE